MADDPNWAAAQDRIRAATDQFSKAVSDAVKLSFRQALAKQIAEDFGPGPWTLHPDGSVEPAEPDDD